MSAAEMASATVYHVVVETSNWDKLAAFGTVAAAIAILVTLALGVYGFLRDKENAQNTAERAEAAARLSIDSTDKLVSALGEIARSFAAGGFRVVPMTAPPTVIWSLTYDVGDRYRLENTGDARAHDVTVKSDQSLALINVPEPGDVGPHEAVTFFAAVSFGTRDLTITITWNDDDGAEHVWRYPLPPKR